jgi:hypothetical protein
MNTPQTWSESPIHEQIRTMNDTPTPETDKHEFPCMTWPSQDHPMVVRADFARRLERERDEVRFDLDFRRRREKIHKEIVHDAIRERDVAREETIRTREFMDHGFAVAQEELAAVTEQRDEVRDALAELRASVLDLSHPNIKMILIERDEAKFDLDFRRRLGDWQSKIIDDLTSERDEAREQLAEIEAKMRAELGGHPDSELWGDAGLIAATMRCVDALDEVTEQRDRLAEVMAQILNTTMNHTRRELLLEQALQSLTPKP